MNNSYTQFTYGYAQIFARRYDDFVKICAPSTIDALTGRRRRRRASKRA